MICIDARHAKAALKMQINKSDRNDAERWSRFPEQHGGLAKVDSGFGYAANFSSVSCVA